MNEQQHLDIARRWFTEGWLTNVELAHHTGVYGGVEATGKPVEVSDIALWRFENGRVTEIRTLQDQFGLLTQIGYLPAGVYAA
ncbi:hypothetical protein GFY24_04670 [Nocardia sp. SYP-A9097]|uniref:ester cyclase n=1 Tax=Nocardia sp. SYP-A9097 TaxID=2663237 RepID=UPI00129BC2A2|nr:ester cyclase [Nocardia sp. SYP-A9097]MRH86769.1 hypothetical protein [Nocardia sp. SYP-A9097]